MYREFVTFIRAERPRRRVTAFAFVYRRGSLYLLLLFFFYFFSLVRTALLTRTHKSSRPHIIRYQLYSIIFGGAQAVVNAYKEPLRPAAQRTIIVRCCYNIPYIQSRGRAAFRARYTHTHIYIYILL